MKEEKDPLDELFKISLDSRKNEIDKIIEDEIDNYLGLFKYIDKNKKYTWVIIYNDLPYMYITKYDYYENIISTFNKDNIIDFFDIPSMERSDLLKYLYDEEYLFERRKTYIKMTDKQLISENHKLNNLYGLMKYVGNNNMYNMLSNETDMLKSNLNKNFKLIKELNNDLNNAIDQHIERCVNTKIQKFILIFCILIILYYVLFA